MYIYQFCNNEISSSTEKVIDHLLNYCKEPFIMSQIITVSKDSKFSITIDNEKTIFDIG
jgi:hypothetical protein